MMVRGLTRVVFGRRLEEMGSMVVEKERERDRETKRGSLFCKSLIAERERDDSDREEEEGDDG